MQVLVHKLASVTANLRLSHRLEISDDCVAESGSVVVVKALEEKRVYDSIELTTGRMAHVSKDDVIAGALGSRRALRGFVGHVPDEVAVGDVLEILNLGGVIGVSTSVNKDLGSPLRVRVLGMAVRGGRVLNIAHGALPLRSSLARCPPTIVVSGTCMHSGKTLAACEIVARLTQKGFRVAAAKASGVACLKDTLNMQDHGAVLTASFLDCGLPSTAGMDDVAPVAKALLARLARARPDVVVVELGDGIIGGYGVASYFRDTDLMRHSRFHVVCANDPVGAWGAKQIMESWGVTIGCMSGPATDNEVGKSYVKEALGLSAANARTEPQVLARIVEAGVFQVPSARR